MEIQEFHRLLEKGLGRPHVYLQTHDPAPYRDIILHACTHDLRFDRQLENSRGRYLFDLIGLTGETAFYRDAVLKALAWRMQEESMNQLFEIVGLFACRGDEGARRALYTAYAEGAWYGDFTGGEDLVQADGLAGLLFATEWFFLYAEKDPEQDEDWLLDWWTGELEERDGKDAAWEFLYRARESNRVAAQLMEVVQARREETRAAREAHEVRGGANYRPPAWPDYATLKQAIAEQGRKTNRWMSMRWGRDASKEDLKQAADDLLREDDPDRLVAYLRIFERRRFPRDPALLLRLARSEDEEIVWAALDALAHVEHPEARALAFELLTGDPRWYGEAVNILSINFQSDDLRLIEPLLMQEMEPWDYHGLEIDTKQFIEAHPEEDAGRALLLLYENGPCSMCRNTCIELLIERGCFPDSYRLECRYDAYADTRKLAGGSE